MKPRMFLRIASVVSLLQGVGHMLGRPWTPSHDAQGAAVTEAMKSYHVHVMGFDRSYMDFYVGFGLILGVFIVVQAALLWQLAAFASTEPARTRPMVVAFLIANLTIAMLEGAFLFAAPLIASGIIALCLGLAVVTARRGSVQAAVAGERV